MKLRRLRQLITGDGNREEITSELAEVYYLASELSMKAQLADRKLDRLKDKQDG